MKKSLLVLALVVSCKANAFDVKQFDSFAQKCAPAISTDTLKALVKTESSFNPYAIGVVNGSIAQPKTFDEAIKAVFQWFMNNHKQNEPNEAFEVTFKSSPYILRMIKIQWLEPLCSISISLADLSDLK